VLSVNAELVRLYWDIGRLIDGRQQEEGWGAAVIPRLARELQNELPEVKGFSERNLKSMLAFYRAYPQPAAMVPQPAAPLPAPEKVQQVAAPFPEALLWSLPWYHPVVLMEKVKDPGARLWYMQQTLANGWSRHVLLVMIQSEAHLREALPRRWHGARDVSGRGPSAASSGSEEQPRMEHGWNTDKENALFLSVSYPCSIRGSSYSSPSCRAEVLAILARAGCTPGTCHGTPNGKDDFPRSQRGGGLEWDVAALTRGALDRRTSRFRPAGSLVLRKGKGPYHPGARPSGKA
jgi:hypothetical protein